MDNLKDELLRFLNTAKEIVGDFWSKYKKFVIIGLVVIFVLMAASFVMEQLELAKQEEAPTISVKILEGQSYDFENPVASYDLSLEYAEYLDISVSEQKIYGLANYPEGVIPFLAKLEDGSYEKYEVTVTSLDTELVHTINIARGSTMTVRDWDASFTAEWSTNDPQVATVDEEGNVTGVDLGTCDITAKITNEIVVTFHISVVDVVLSPINPYTYVGDSTTFTLLGYTPAADEKMFIDSDNLDVATVKGMKARAIAEGEANISIALNDKTYTSTMTVLGMPSVQDVIVTVDCDAELVVANIPNFADCEELTVADETIATLTDGKIHGNAIGTTQLIGKIKGHDFSCKITVTGATLVADPNAKYDTTYNKYSSYDNLFKYSVEENESLKIYFTNANSNTPAVKTQDNNFRVFDVTNEYIEVIGTNPGVGMMVVDFDDNRLYAEIHVQHTNATVTQREWEFELKSLTDTLKANGDWTYSADEVQGAYLDAKSELTRKINGISLINYALQELKVFNLENYLTIGEDGKIAGSEETMQIVDKYIDKVEDFGEDYKEFTPENLSVGDIVIWKDGNVSVYMGLNNNKTMTWYEVNEKLTESDGFFTRFYSEGNKSGSKPVQVLKLHYTL